MVTVTASLAAALLQQNLSVGMFAAADQETVVLPRQGQAYLWAILQALAPLSGVPAHPLEQVLSRARTLVTGNDLLVVITPSLQPGWIGPLRQISGSRGGRGRAEVILLDAQEDEPLPPASEAGRKVEDFWQVLGEQGLSAHVLRWADVRRISGYYGEVSRWEFSVLGTGRAVARKAPRMAAVLPNPAVVEHSHESRG